ncbi:hypothetical protein FANTH_14638 [Fusarium anthophilum]|uniref:Chromo domain-containing protein n=1 Tax=Fusarium anthophilum TaxID=48485 RepID=A0A8H4YHK3_9HYPO|nr:hypothetical protein FANTH_14638 [Fusarium anthophilum]
MVHAPPIDEIYRHGEEIPANTNRDATSGVDSKPKTYTVACLTGHELDEKTFTVEFDVKWAKEPEWRLQEDIPELVFAYWKGKGGREKATGFTSYHVFRILRGPVGGKYLVQWVGFPDFEDEVTWEEESKLRKVAKVELEKFRRRSVIAGNSSNGTR